MAKQHLKTAGILAVATFLLSAGNGALSMMPTVKLGSEMVKLEVAETRKEIEDGLMYRTAMPETQGMVFLFHPPTKVAFWMYHTLIPLDMIFIKDGKIKKICKDVPPCKNKDPKGSDCDVYPDRNLIDVSEVIEVNAGFCDRHGVKEGDEVKFDFKK